MEFEGKVAIVTGAGQGIGRGAAEALAEKGARVVIIAEINTEKGQACADEICAAGHQAEFYPTDVRDRAQVNALFDHVMETYGRVDFLINNAGISAPNPVCLDLDQKDWDNVVATNLHGLMYCAQRAYREMEKQGKGKIVNIASVAGLNGGDASPVPYAATKGAVISLTRALSTDFRAHGVSVNNLALGVVKTPIWDPAPPEALNAVASKIRVGRMGTSEEVGRICAFMCSDDAEFIEGSTIVAHGGVRNCVF